MTQSGDREIQAGHIAHVRGVLDTSSRVYRERVADRAAFASRSGQTRALHQQSPALITSLPARLYPHIASLASCRWTRC
jgi:hypothetical protein